MYYYSNVLFQQNFYEMPLQQAPTTMSNRDQSTLPASLYTGKYH